MTDGLLDLSAFQKLLERPYYRERLWFTTWQAALSTLLTLGLALPAAHVFARYRFPGKSLLLALSTLPFVLPTVVVAAAFKSLLGEGSTLNQGLMQLLGLEEAPIQLDRTLTLVLIAHVFYNYAIALRIISSFWANQNIRTQEAARVLGANGLVVFRRITLPALLPAIAAAGALVFIFTFTSFGVMLLLGNQQTATLEIEIYRWSRIDLQTAAALSVVQLLATLLLMVLYTSLQRHMSQPVDLQSAQTTMRPVRSWQARLWVGANLLVIVVLILLPIFALVERSFTLGTGGFSLRYYEALTENTRRSLIFVPPIEAIGNSLRIALAATGIAVLLGTLAAYLLAGRGRIARWLDPLFMLPLATSAVTLGFGFVIMLNGSGRLDALLAQLPGIERSPLLSLRSSFWLIPIVHTLVATPFVVRSVLPALRGIRPSVREAAAVLGASRWRRWWRIELPMVGRSILVGATFAFTISMGEFGAAVFLVRPNEPTIPIVIFRFLGQPGLGINYGQALAMSVILMAVCTAGFLLIERLNRLVIGEF